MIICVFRIQVNSSILLSLDIKPRLSPDGVLYTPIPQTVRTLELDESFTVREEAVWGRAKYSTGV